MQVLCKILLSHFIFSGFLNEESEISVHKDFDHVLAMCSWQIC